jgi:hypothetical protein
LFFVQTPWIVWSVTPVVFYLTPALLWLFGWNLYPQARPDDVLAIPLLLFLTISVAMSWLSRLHWVPILSAASQLFIAIELAPTAVTSLIKPFGKSLIRIMPVTAKGASATSQGVDRRTFGVLIGLALVTLGSFLFSAITDSGPAHHPAEMMALSFWTIYALVVIAVASLMCFEPHWRSAEKRFAVSQPVDVVLADRRGSSGMVLDVSLSGARVRLLQEVGLQLGEPVSLGLPGFGWLSSRIARLGCDGEIGLSFDALGPSLRASLIRTLFTDPHLHTPISKYRAMPIFADLIRRYIGAGERA